MDPEWRCNSVEKWWYSSQICDHLPEGLVLQPFKNVVLTTIDTQKGRHDLKPAIDFPKPSTVGARWEIVPIRRCIAPVTYLYGHLWALTANHHENHVQVSSTYCVANQRSCWPKCAGRHQQLCQWICAFEIFVWNVRTETCGWIFVGELACVHFWLVYSHSAIRYLYIFIICT